MNQFYLLTFLGLILCSALPAAAKPNIIAIMADDMGFKCMSSNGMTSYQAPHLDRLAKGSILFTHSRYAPPHACN
jgi:arylsulfatase A